MINCTIISKFWRQYGRGSKKDENAKIKKLHMIESMIFQNMVLSIFIVILFYIFPFLVGL